MAQLAFFLTGDEFDFFKRFWKYNTNKVMGGC